MSATDKIKFAFLNRKKGKKKNKPVLKSVNDYNQVLLFTSSDNHKLTEVIARTFSNATCYFAYERKKKEVDPNNLDFSYHVSDLNLTGKIKNDKLNELLHTPFDLVIDLCPEGQLTYYLLDQINQSFMIGKRGNNRSHMYNLILPDELNDDETIKLITQQITLLSQNGTK